MSEARKYQEEAGKKDWPGDRRKFPAVIDPSSMEKRREKKRSRFQQFMFILISQTYKSLFL